MYIVTYSSIYNMIGFNNEVDRLKAQVQLGWEKEFRTLKWLGLKDGMNILDVGGGPGFYCEKLLENLPNSRVTILDIDDKLLRIAKNRLSNSYYNNRIAFKKTSVYKTGIKDNTYITPLSTSILPSITNKSLMQLAEDMGMKVERRPVAEEELTTFEEAGACGTAAVISPIERIDDPENGHSYVIAKDGKPGPVCTKLYNKLRGIQYGDEPDTHGWVTIVE